MNRKLTAQIYDNYSKLVRFFSFKGFAPMPPLIVWEPTYKCNLRCKMCPFYGPSGTIPIFKDEMTLDEIKAVFSNIRQSYRLFLPRIHMTGGEPLIHKNFPEIVAYLKKLGFKYSITTNFTFLSEAVFGALIKYPPADLRISLDGPAKIHDTIRGVNGTFNRVIKNIQRIKEARISIPIRFNCTISNDNVDYLGEMVEIARKNKAHLNFQHLMFIDNKHLKAHELLFDKVFGFRPYPLASKSKIRAEEVSKVINKINKIKKMKKMHCNITFLPELKTEEIRDYYLDLDHYVHSPYCFTVWSLGRIAPNGKMYPCFEYFFGDLKVESFKDVWNGKKARRFREILKRRKLFPGCVRCCKI